MIERRFVKGAEVRAKDDGHIHGHAAVFDQECVLWDSPGYRAIEIVKPGAFERALKEKQDVRCLFNHSPDNVLGRTTAGTMTMKEDDQGLYFDTDPPDTQVARDVRTLVRRKDITGCSFAFTVTKQTVREEEIDKKTIRTREIEDVDLYDVGPVTYPAYEGTDVNSRMRELRAEMFPGGLPQTIRDLVPDLRDDSDDKEECKCRCRACMSAECDECEMYMAECSDPNCDHDSVGDEDDRASSKTTKRVDGEDLPASAFLYVGDPQKTATWSLPWKFSTDAKTKSHLRNALARFNQTKKIPADKKAAVRKKLVRLCKKYGIKVSDQEAKSWGVTQEERDSVGSTSHCRCDCAECQVGDCEDCSDSDCEDPNCEHEPDEDDRSRLLAEAQMYERTRLAKAGD
jgi:Escherichia/Staphylococcus phage prohead protease